LPVEKGIDNNPRDTPAAPPFVMLIDTPEPIAAGADCLVCIAGENGIRHLIDCHENFMSPAARHINRSGKCDGGRRQLAHKQTRWTVLQAAAESPRLQ
jgi:hypothetical protein